MANNNDKIQRKGKNIDVKKEVFEWIEAIAIALILTIVIRTYFFSVIKVKGNSMLPTLYNNDRLIVVQFMYKPKQGDIIILTPPEHKDTPFVKRVIALSGQTVNIDFDNHKVYVDGEELDEDYVLEPIEREGDIKFPVRVSEDCVFVLGDNRNNSRDSRYSDVGMVPYKAIMGKSTFRIWPLSRFGSIYK